MPTVLSDRAAENLRFIRDTMAHAGAFTSVSGAGTIGAGVVGLAASLAASPAAIGADPRRFLTVWITAAVVAGAISGVAIRRKARRAGQSLVDGPARRFTLAFVPALAAGAVLTVALVAAGQTALLPGTWLVLYGAAIAAGGARRPPSRVRLSHHEALRWLSNLRQRRHAALNALRARLRRDFGHTKATSRWHPRSTRSSTSASGWESSARWQ
jgi:hypothetical protein